MTASPAEELPQLHPDHRPAPARRRTSHPPGPGLRLVDDDTLTRARRAGRRDRTTHVVSVLLAERPELEGVSGVADVMAEALVWSA